MVLVSPDYDIVEYTIMFMFRTTNNEAEYEVTIAGLQLCLSTGAKKVCLKTDSQLVAHQFKGDYKVREPSLTPGGRTCKLMPCHGWQAPPFKTLKDRCCRGAPEEEHRDEWGIPISD
ncbi:hypothetical protein RDABS01_016596 [Bienertia sinuspersici]